MVLRYASEAELNQPLQMDAFTVESDSSTRLSGSRSIRWNMDSCFHSSSQGRIGIPGKLLEEDSTESSDVSFLVLRQETIKSLIKQLLITYLLNWLTTESPVFFCFRSGEMKLHLILVLSHLCT